MWTGRAPTSPSPTSATPCASCAPRRPSSSAPPFSPHCMPTCHPCAPQSRPLTQNTKLCIQCPASLCAIVMPVTVRPGRAPLLISHMLLLWQILGRAGWAAGVPVPAALQAADAAAAASGAVRPHAGGLHRLQTLHLCSHMTDVWLAWAPRKRSAPSCASWYMTVMDQGMAGSAFWVLSR